MKIHLAQHHGMCFGVRDALRATHDAARREPVTLLGQLVHNPVVEAHLQTLGVRRGELDQPGLADTHRVVISAHGAADRMHQAWRQAGHVITDTTCPLVRKAHLALSVLVQEGYHPVVIGQRHHVEVRGLIGDFPGASVVLDEVEVLQIPVSARLGVVAQTTQPLDRVLERVAAIKRQQPGAEVRFIDTVCHPTKQRQSALEDLCLTCPVIVVIGGRNSNNTRQLAEKAVRLGARAHQVETPDDLRQEWFAGISDVGITAGTSTLDETVTAVMERLRRMREET